MKAKAKRHIEQDSRHLLAEQERKYRLEYVELKEKLAPASGALTD